MGTKTPEAEKKGEVREQWIEVCEAAMKVARQMMLIDGEDAWEVDNVEYWQEDEDSITVSGTNRWRDNLDLGVPWEFVEAHLEDRDWQSIYRTRIEDAKATAEEARRVKEAADKAERAERREKRDRSEYERLRKKYDADA